MTKEQYERLRPFDGVLEKVVKGEYIHMAAADMDVLASVYKDVYDVVVTATQRNCQSCIKQILRQLGIAYQTERARGTYKEKYVDIPLADVAAKPAVSKIMRKRTN